MANVNGPGALFVLRYKFAISDSRPQREFDFERLAASWVRRPGEAAYYEYIRKRAGIKVHYCAEEFENDGSLYAAVAKNLKRAMAGEYSRDLSVKVFAGQRRLVMLGFSPGASTMFRRYLSN
jgi:hypothetical protein